MKRIFYYYIFFSLTLACSFKAIALVPLQGLIYGDVRDTKQYDPLSGVFSQDAISNPDQVNSVEETKFQEYIGLYKDGANLKNSCEQGSIFQYDSPWKEATAKRSIVSTLQYIGLDISLKAIVEYAKLLELPKENFDNIVENLITNTCSKNLSVYSIKLLRNNFKHYYENNTGFD